MASLHTELARHLARHDRAAARRACRAVSRNDLARVTHISDALVAAAHDRQHAVVRFLCRTFATSAYVTTAAVGQALASLALLPQEEEATAAALLHSLLCIPLPRGTRGARSACFLLHQAAGLGWVQALQELCHEDMLQATFSPSDLQGALQVAALRGHAAAVSVLCTPRLMRYGVQPAGTRTILVSAAERGDCTMLATLGQVGVAWPPEVTHPALLAATAGGHPRSMRILCAPPFSAPVLRRDPCPLLLIATDGGHATALEVLLAAAASALARDGDGADRDALQVARHKLVYAMSAALQHKRLATLHRFFEFCAHLDFGGDNGDSDGDSGGERLQAPTASHSVSHVIVAGTLAASHHRVALAPHARVALVALEQLPGGDNASRDTLAFLLQHLCDIPDECLQCEPVRRLLRALTSLWRWRLRGTLLLLRRLRATNRAVPVVAAPRHGQLRWRRW